MVPLISMPEFQVHHVLFCVMSRWQVLCIQSLAIMQCGHALQTLTQGMTFFLTTLDIQISEEEHPYCGHFGEPDFLVGLGFYPCLDFCYCHQNIQESLEPIASVF